MNEVKEVQSLKGNPEVRRQNVDKLFLRYNVILEEMKMFVTGTNYLTDAVIAGYVVNEFIPVLSGGNEDNTLIWDNEHARDAKRVLKIILKDSMVSHAMAESAAKQIFIGRRGIHKNYSIFSSAYNEMAEKTGEDYKLLNEVYDLISTVKTIGEYSDFSYGDLTKFINASTDEKTKLSMTSEDVRSLYDISRKAISTFSTARDLKQRAGFNAGFKGALFDAMFDGVADKVFQEKLESVILSSFHYNENNIVSVVASKFAHIY